MVSLFNDDEDDSDIFNIKGELTLLTRIGGIIGVGKEFLWIIITLLSFLLTIKSRIFHSTITGRGLRCQEELNDEHKVEYQDGHWT